MAGFVTQRGAFAQVGGVLHRLPAAPITLQQWAADMTALIPCPHCGERGGCDCLEWLDAMGICPQCGGDVCDCVDVAKLLAAMEADPHGQLDRSVEIPF